MRRKFKPGALPRDKRLVCAVTRKICFKSHGSAMQKAQFIMTHDPLCPPSLGAYQCAHCGQWHLTKQ